MAPSAVEALAAKGLQRDGNLIDATALQGVHMAELEEDPAGAGAHAHSSDPVSILCGCAYRSSLCEAARAEVVRACVFSRHRAFVGEGAGAGADASAKIRDLAPLPGTLVVLDLRGNRLVRVPPGLPASLQALYLGSNWLCELPRWLPARLPNLEVLDGHMNNMLYVHRDVFAMPALHTLALAQNVVLRGSGRLAKTLRSGAGVSKLRGIANGMTATQWCAELDSLRRGGHSV